MTHVAAAWAICRRDLALFTTYRMRFLSVFFTGAVTLTLFYYISRLIHSARVASPNRYYASVVIGVIVIELVSSTLATPAATLRQELLTGTFERMVVSPFGAVRSVASLMVFPAVLSLTLGVLTLVYATILFGLSLHWATLVPGLAVAVLGAIAFAPFGLAIAAAVLVFKQTNAGATLVVTAVTLLAGVYFPITLLPHAVRWAADVQPFTPTLDLMRNLIVGTPLREPALVSVVKLVAFPAVLIPVALKLLETAVRVSSRRGTVTEY